MDAPPPELKVNFPYVLSDRGISVKIYQSTNNGYPSFFVHWHGPNGKCRKRCATFEKAQMEAALVIDALSRGQTEVLNLSNDDRLVYLQAQNYLRPLDVRVDQVCREYAEAKKHLGNAELLKAVKFFEDHHANNVDPKGVSQIVAELLRERARDGRSEVYLKALRTTLGRFAEAFPRSILTIKRAEIETYLQRAYASLSPRSQNNAASCIVTLFTFAKSRGYLPRDKRTEATDLARAKEYASDNEILTPAEMEQLLSRVSAVPAAAIYVALGGFAGIRTAEIKRMTWEDVDFEHGCIKLDTEVTKTVAWRVVPMTANLMSILLQCGGNRKGPVVKLARPEKTASELLAKGFQHPDGTIEKGRRWKHDALRNSYITYRLAIVKSLDQVALEAGNSSRAIQRHCCEAVSEGEAQEWFAIRFSSSGQTLKRPTNDDSK